MFRFFTDTLALLRQLLLTAQAIHAVLRELLHTIAAVAARHEILLQQILEAVTPPTATGFIFFTEEGEITNGQLNMTNSQQKQLSIEPVGKDGKPAPIDGVPVWASSDETIVTVTPDPTGLTAIMKAVGPQGKCKVTVTGDADLGAGVKPIFGELEVEITQGLAVGFKITEEAPTEQ